MCVCVCVCVKCLDTLCSPNINLKQKCSPTIWAQCAVQKSNGHCVQSQNQSKTQNLSIRSTKIRFHTMAIENTTCSCNVYECVCLYEYVHTCPVLNSPPNINLCRKNYCCERVAKIHKMPYLDRSFSAKEPPMNSGSFAERDL